MDVEKVIRSISYRPDYTLRCEEVSDGGYLVAVVHERADALTGEWKEGVGGGAIITADWTEDAIVRKCFSLFLQYEEHECRESFRYEGAQVFGPHIKIRALMSVADQLG